MNFIPVLKELPFLLRGALLVIEVTFASILLASLIGIPVGIARTYGSRTLRWVLSVPVDILRALPLLVLIVGTFYALPLLTSRSISPFAAGVISLGLYYAAMLSEVFRAGLQSIGPGQRAAAAALGMTTPQILRRVLLPQATIMMIPPLGSLLSSLIKSTSLLYGIGVTELMWQAGTLNSLISRPFEVFTVAGIIYAAIVYPIVLLTNWAYGRLSLSVGR